MANPEKTFWQHLSEEAVEAAKLMKEDLDDLRTEYGAAAKHIEKKAASALIKAGELYVEHGVEERTWGAAAGAKAGAAIGWKVAGPLGIKPGIIIGGGLGLAFGKKGIDRIKSWRDKHDPTKNGEAANGNDAATHSHDQGDQPKAAP